MSSRAIRNCILASVQDGDYSIESRSCSAVHIRLFQTPPPRAAKSAEKTVP